MAVTPGKQAFAQDLAPSSAAGTSRGLIIVGLPGDSAHAIQFRSTANRWRKWLTGSLQFPASEVRVLSGATAEPGFSEGPATRESIESEVAALLKKTGPNDRVWVFVLGHANIDHGHAFVHLPGPDLSDDRFSKLFRGLTASEQVFWMTTAGSGAFVKPLSKVGRIVIAATEPEGEVNETEFPHILAEISARAASQLDLDRDGKVSIQEIFAATSGGVDARFATDKRAPTEHAQLDDDGDGVGTELKSQGKPTKPDGTLASKIFLPYVSSKEAVKPQPRSDRGTNSTLPLAAR